MVSVQKLALAFGFFLAATPLAVVAAGEELTAEQLVELVLASKARYVTFAATVEKTLLYRPGAGKPDTTSTVEITWRQRTDRDAWFVRVVERQGGVETVRTSAREGNCLKRFSSTDGIGNGKISSREPDQEDSGTLTPDSALWNPLGYPWRDYVTGAQKVVREGGMYYLTAEVIDGRAVVTVAIDAEHGYLPVRYDLRLVGQEGSRQCSSHDLKEVNGLWVPMRYEVQTRSPDGWEALLSYKVREIVLNQSIPDEQLELQFPEGMEISDETTQFLYKVPPAGMPPDMKEVGMPMNPEQYFRASPGGLCARLHMLYFGTVPPGGGPFSLFLTVGRNRDLGKEVSYQIGNSNVLTVEEVKRTRGGTTALLKVKLRPDKQPGTYREDLKIRGAAEDDVLSVPIVWEVAQPIMAFPGRLLIDRPNEVFRLVLRDHGDEPVPTLTGFHVEGDSIELLGCEQKGESPELLQLTVSRPKAHEGYRSAVIHLEFGAESLRVPCAIAPATAK